MRLTRAGEYAIRCILYMSKQGREKLVSRKEIADACEIPHHFLAKIAQELAKAGIIEIRQGAKGGFILIKDPYDISMLQVIEAIIGEIYLNDCIARPESCKASPVCSVHKVWETARQQLRTTLGSVTFQQLLDEQVCDFHLSLEAGAR
jgi:Rrf2 family protein